MLSDVRAKKFLQCLLVFNGVLTLFALPAIFMPTDLMDQMHQRLGLGPLPAGPLVQYLTRSISALYAAFGALTLLLVWDVRRYAPLITWWGITAIVFGALLFWIDVSAPMPKHWTWGEAPYLILNGVVILVLQALSRLPRRDDEDLM